MMAVNDPYGARPDLCVSHSNVSGKVSLLKTQNMARLAFLPCMGLFFVFIEELQQNIFPIQWNLTVDDYFVVCCRTRKSQGLPENLIECRLVNGIVLALE